MIETGKIKRDKHRFGGNREIAIQRDGEKCVKCGLTRNQHKEKYSQDITVDHIDRKGRNVKTKDKNNSLNNLQTLCLICHSRKDGRARKLSIEKVISIRKQYKDGKPQYQICSELHLSSSLVSAIINNKCWNNINQRGANE